MQAFALLAYGESGCELAEYRIHYVAELSRRVVAVKLERTAERHSNRLELHKVEIIEFVVTAERLRSCRNALLCVFDGIVTRLDILFAILGIECRHIRKASCRGIGYVVRSAENVEVVFVEDKAVSILCDISDDVATLFGSEHFDTFARFDFHLSGVVVVAVKRRREGYVGILAVDFYEHRQVCIVVNRNVIDVFAFVVSVIVFTAVGNYA